MRLISCSNSAPQVDAETGAMLASPGFPGGLVPIMVSLMQQVGGQWIYTAPAGAPASGGGGRITLKPLTFDDRLAAAHYSGVSIRTLLWLFHYVFDTTYDPMFGADFTADWAGYEAVNERFAAALTTAQHNEPEEVVLVHDFHFLRVPHHLARHTPHRRNRLVYFHHVPWCEPDYFGLLPDRIRRSVLESLLRCDVIGFHCRRWADAFLACCARFVPGATVDGSAIEFDGHRGVVAVAPGPIDADALESLRTDPLTGAWRDRLRARAAGRRPIVRVDRLDLWKNVGRGLEAFELLLAPRPDLAHELWFCAIVTPPRRPTDRSARYRRHCEATAARINERYGTGPVDLIYPDEGANSRHRAVAALEISAATLVNPTLDGLNMVAKEAMVVGGDAPLLLSVNAGAYDQLRTGVLPVQPYDLEMTADALLAGVTGTTAGGAAACRADLRWGSAARWLDELLTAR
ncbi:trehalose-6-phosphate synthase [Catenuloplanes indicus]|uniref:Trehalose 6-phosphate synthase n=1 Tax=Catenuloplanes indicus TaxID=137267 RepID=A0AAE3VUV6_9ACTN|nr:trehalose-6-phosphate synthase [Catenuloplanes indicus]MDQ0364448.1 trehalose 6-phosphate synthase [Catenuloplanes indicus]